MRIRHRTDVANLRSSGCRGVMRDESTQRFSELRSHAIECDLTVDERPNLLLDRCSEGGPRTIEETGCVEIRAVLDTALRELLTRHFPGYVEQHHMPQITRLLVCAADGGIHRDPNIVEQGMRCLVKQH